MKDNLINSKRIARWFNDRGLQDLVAFLVDVVRPFRVFAAQTAYFMEPILGGRSSLIRDLAEFLEDPDQMDELIDQLYKDVEDNG